MTSTTYEHFVDTNKMYAAQEQFRGITKMVCARFRGITKMVCARFRGLTKTYHFADAVKMVTFCHRFAVIGSMVRNAGQLPQPFWLGSARGGGSHSLSASVARA